MSETPQLASPAEIRLTEDGLAPEGAGKVLLLACGALAREVLAVTEGSGWDHIDLACLPAILHNHPDQIPDAVEQAVRKHAAQYETIFVVYADCGTGGLLQERCDALGVEMVTGPHCYSFFEGNQNFADRGEIDAFYLTDFLVRQFDAFVTRPLGLERHPELLDMYFGQYKTLVYQAQSDDPVLTERAKLCAEALGLSFERRFTGYGDLPAALSPFSNGQTG